MAMTHRMLATAIALLFGLSMTHGVAAKGHGSGHSGGGHSGGGHSGGGHSGGGHSGGGHSAGGHASAGQSKGGSVHGGGVRAGGSAPAAPRGPSPATPGSTPQPRGYSRPPDVHGVVGTAVPRSPHSRDLFVVTPSIYAPRFSHLRLPDLGFGFGI